MSTPLVPEKPTSPPTPTGSPPSSTPPAGSTTNATDSASNPTPQAWRAPANAPAWAAGKTADEILGLSQQMYSVLERFNQQAAATRPPEPAYPTPVQSNGDLADDDYVNGAALKRYLQQASQQYVAPQMQQVHASNAGLALGIVQQRYGDDFRRYGPEINAMIANLPLEARNLDNLERVVKFVRSEHLDQLVEEKARALAQEMSGQMASGLRSSGSPTGVPLPADNQASIQNEALPALWREKAAKVGLTDQTVREFCVANGMTPEEFFKQFEGNVMTDKAVARV